MAYKILDKKQIMMASNNVNSNVTMVMHDGILDFGFYQIWSHLEDQFRWNILHTSSSDSYPHFIFLKLKRELRKIKLDLFIYILKCCTYFKKTDMFARKTMIASVALNWKTNPKMPSQIASKNRVQCKSRGCLKLFFFHEMI